MKYYLKFIIPTFLFFAFTLNPGDGDKKFPKVLTDDNSKFTNVGNIGLTVTNFGTYGSGFVLWPDQPSCEYPLGSGIEHIFDGGLWIGAFIANDSLGGGKIGPFVTTGAVDVASVSNRGGGFEYTNAPGELVLERSSLFDSRFFDPAAISHQDFVMDFVDTNTVLENGDPIADHDPIGLSIHQETYAWDFPFANFFVILNYWIKNVSDKYLDSVYVGLWTDTVVRNTLITGRPSGSAFYNKGGNGYNDSLQLAYEFDAAGSEPYFFAVTTAKTTLIESPGARLEKCPLPKNVDLFEGPLTKSGLMPSFHLFVLLKKPLIFPKRSTSFCGAKKFGSFIFRNCHVT